MTDDLAKWKEKIVVVHRKRGRTLTTGIIHVNGTEPPPEQVLLLAMTDWTSMPIGQIVRRPDENEMQVYWVNIFN